MATTQSGSSVMPLCAHNVVAQEDLLGSTKDALVLIGGQSDPSEPVEHLLAPVLLKMSSR